MSIHTIGDSHATNGWYGVIEHHLGPLLCYSFGKGKLNRCNILDYNIKNGDSIIFCLGEIDCRCHIYKHVNENTTYQQIINEIIDNYFEAIDINIKNSNLKLKNICVFNVVPPIQRYKTNEPSVLCGSDEERKEYVLYFNKKIKEKCLIYKYIFFDVYDKYTDNNGFLNYKLSDTRVHIKNGYHLGEFIINKLKFKFKKY